MDIIIIAVSLVITLIAQAAISGNYKKYSSINLKKEQSGAEIAREILDKNGLNNIYVVETRGVLSDHYDPRRKVIRLSNNIYSGKTIAAAAVAAHEVGHALQDKAGYGFFKIRAAIVPIVNLASYLGYITLALFAASQIRSLFVVSAVLLGSTLVFHLVTLPVEFDATRRAKSELAKGFLNSSEQEGARKMLGSAAFTYVAGMITNILQFLRVFARRR